jgi:hypothetical protein
MNRQNWIVAVVLILAASAAAFAAPVPRPVPQKPAPPQPQYRLVVIQVVVVGEPKSQPPVASAHVLITQHLPGGKTKRMPAQITEAGAVTVNLLIGGTFSSEVVWVTKTGVFTGSSPAVTIQPSTIGWGVNIQREPVRNK